MVTTLEALIFAAMTAVMAMLFVPAELQLRVRRAIVRNLRSVADVIEHVDQKKEPKKGLFGSVTVVSVERAEDPCAVLAQDLHFSINQANRRIDALIADYQGDMSSMRWEIQCLKDKALATKVDIDTGEFLDQASELRSMVKPVKRRRPRKQ